VGRDETKTAVEQLANGFNPRARVGRDESHWGQFPKMVVSIHAPVWGATKQWGSIWTRCWCFNPRARVGRDQRRIDL